MADLPLKKCIPCEAGALPMSESEIRAALHEVPGWELNKDGKIRREWILKNFADAVTFINRVAELAEKEGHHPDMLIYNWHRVRLELITHAIHGLSQNDFIMAAKINTLCG